MSALIDTGVLFAFLNRDDRRHAQASAIIRDVLKGTYGVPCVADGVVQELFTLIRARTGDGRMEDNAFELLLGTGAFARRVRFLPCGPDVFRAAFAVFVRAREQRLSFVDACLLVLKDDLQLQSLLTFDDALARWDASSRSGPR